MNNACTGEWSRKFMRDNFTLTFITKDFREHQKNVLIEQQLALMPDSQLVIEERKRIERLTKKINKQRKELRDIREHYKQIESEIIGEYNKKTEAILALKGWHTHYYGGLFMEVVKRTAIAFEGGSVDNGLYLALNGIIDNHAKIEDLIKSTEESLETFKSKMAPEWDNKHKVERDKLVADCERRIGDLIADRGTKSRAKREFIRKCGDAECRGFLSTRWKCGVCEKTTCVDCHEVVVPDHVCNPDCVATIKLLKTDTRDCPNCQTSILKIDGCDQMWCTQCKTGFSWTTGKIEMKLHNPHYYEWRRQNGGLDREPGDMQCGDVLGADMATQMAEAMIRHPSIDDTTAANICESVRRCVHISAYNHPPIAPNYEENRISYLNKQMDIEEFKNILVRSDKAHAKKNELYTVYGLLTVTFTDIIRRLNNDMMISDMDMYDRGILNEVNTIVDYVNGCFADIGYSYSCISKHEIGYNMSTYRVSLKGKKV